MSMQSSGAMAPRECEAMEKISLSSRTSERLAARSAVK
jgi:hypothetical protein